MDPIFIIGSERSGTNLLRLILNSHTNIVIPHPPHILKNFSYLEKRYKKYGLSPGFEILLEDVIKAVELHHYPWEIKIDKKKILEKAKYKNLINIFFLIYEQYKEFSGKKRWGCKSTFMISHVEDIIKYLPNAKFIYLVRDGRDVFSSAKNSIFNYYTSYYTSKLWAKEQRLGIKWLKMLSHNQIYLLKYEDLIKDTEKEIKSLCCFLNEPFEKAMLSFYKDKEAKKSSQISIAWKNTALPILKNNSQKFHKTLSKKEIELFTTISKKELEYFSYRSENICMVSSKWKLRYLIYEILYFIKVEIIHILQDKNNLLRIKKSIFLKYLWLVR